MASNSCPIDDNNNISNQKIVEIYFEEKNAKVRQAQIAW